VCAPDAPAEFALAGVSCICAAAHVKEREHEGAGVSRSECKGAGGPECWHTDSWRGRRRRLRPEEIAVERERVMILRHAVGACVFSAVDAVAGGQTDGMPCTLTARQRQRPARSLWTYGRLLALASLTPPPMVRRRNRRVAPPNSAGLRTQGNRRIMEPKKRRRGDFMPGWRLTPLGVNVCVCVSCVCLVCVCACVLA
jgi:hypothetical protein